MENGERVNVNTEELEIHRCLLAPFPPEKVKWRVGQAYWAKGKAAEDGQVTKGRVLAYIDVRDRDERLDEAFGPFNWEDHVEIVAGGFLCHLTAVVGGRKITRSDGAPATDIESFKGGISDAKKRAGVAFGIARYLYDLGETEAKIVCLRGGDRPVWGIPADELKRLDALLVAPTAVQQATNVVNFLEHKRNMVVEGLKKKHSVDKIKGAIAQVVDELGGAWDALDDENKMRYILLLGAKLG